MDLGSERSVEDNELAETEDLQKNGEIDTQSKDNGNYDAEIVDGELLAGKTSPSPATKGRGLRKWRRIRREAGKETNSSLDSNRKRGMIGLPVAMKQRSEGSSSSTHALDHNLVYGDLQRGSDIASRADSDNSEDQNSTAASNPKPNQKIHVTTSSNGNNNSGVSVKPGDDQLEKSRNQTKKARGGSKLKKENSISSMESDSRSSNFVFTQGSNSVTSNGRKNGRLVNYEEDYSDGDRQTQPAFSKHEDDSEYVSHEDLAAEEDKDHVDGDEDSLVDSIIPLHLAHEALEKEVQKLRDVGKEDTLSSDESFKSSAIEEARVMIELKNAKILELESILNLGDYEQLLMQRIAAELEYLVISETIQNLMSGHIDQINNLAVQQKKQAVVPVPVPVPDPVQDDVGKLQNRVRRYGLCFMIQLVLLVVVVYMFVLQFSSEPKVIPT